MKSHITFYPRGTAIPFCAIHCLFSSFSDWESCRIFAAELVEHSAHKDAVAIARASDGTEEKYRK